MTFTVVRPFYVVGGDGKVCGRDESLPYKSTAKRSTAVSRGPGMPGPYGLLFTVQKFSKNNLANARIICYDNKLKTCSVPKGHGHIEQRESF